MTRTRYLGLAILLYVFAVVCGISAVAGMWTDAPVWVIGLRLTGAVGTWIAASYYRTQGR